MALGAATMMSCASTKPTVVSETVIRQPAVSLEGENVNSESIKMQGIEMSESLNDDGTEMISRPFKWYAGIGKADNKQIAIELAQREAYATISRALNSAVLDQAVLGNVANNGRVQQALISHWKQVAPVCSKVVSPSET